MRTWMTVCVYIYTLAHLQCQLPMLCWARSSLLVNNETYMSSRHMARNKLQNLIACIKVFSSNAHSTESDLFMEIYKFYFYFFISFCFLLPILLLYLAHVISGGLHACISSSHPRCPILPQNYYWWAQCFLGRQRYRATNPYSVLIKGFTSQRPSSSSSVIHQ